MPHFERVSFRLTGCASKSLGCFLDKPEISLRISEVLLPHRGIPPAGHFAVRDLAIWTHASWGKETSQLPRDCWRAWKRRHTSFTQMSTSSLFPYTGSSIRIERNGRTYLSVHTHSATKIEPIEIRQIACVSSRVFREKRSGSSG